MAEVADLIDTNEKLKEINGDLLDETYINVKQKPQFIA